MGRDVLNLNLFNHSAQTDGQTDRQTGAGLLWHLY